MGKYEEYQTSEKESMEQTLELLARGLSREKKEELDYAGIATYLHNLYSGVENILKHILKHRGIQVTFAEGWHKELLKDAVSQDIVSESLADQLREYLRFRHFFIHGYGFMLKPELLTPLAERAEAVMHQFLEEIGIL